MKFKRIVAGFEVAILAVFLFVVLLHWTLSTKLQTLVSRDGRFEATLVRMDGIDRNYSVRINGNRVYTSPDFSPTKQFPFREALMWDKTGTIVVLEIARHRIFGFDAIQQRQLTDDELLALELAADPRLWEYFFESEWPGVGRVRRPN